jgi:hypothetical protein
MIQAMHEVDLDPPIIEDLVRFGRDRGIELGRTEGIELGRTEGIELGRTEGIELGRTEGIELGRTEGERRALITLLGARGLTPSVEQLALIDSEHDPERLLAWLRHAATATSVDDVFAEQYR